MPSNGLLIQSARVLTPEGWLDNHSVLIKNRKISRIAPDIAASQAVETLDAKGLDLVPGFIDLHVHGAGGSDFMDATPQAVNTICAQHAAGGTTSLLATTATHSRQRLDQALDNLDTCLNQGTEGASLLGVHMEGPYFAQEKKGCHRMDDVRIPDPQEWEAWLGRGSLVRHLTLAPELPGAENLIKQASQAGLTVAAGHSMATHEQIRKSMEWGLRHVTHLYCAMSSVSKDGPRRNAGLLEAALLEEGLSTELISDGHHVPDSLARLGYKNKGPGSMALVTDAMRGLNMPDGTYAFGGEEGTPARVQDGVAMTLDGTGFASSCATMADVVRVAVEAHGQPYEEVLERASGTPARICGLEGQKGKIAPGYDGDLVLLGPGVRVEKTIVAGTLVASR